MGALFKVLAAGSNVALQKSLDAKYFPYKNAFKEGFSMNDLLRGKNLGPFRLSREGFEGYYRGEWIRLNWIWARAFGVVGESLPDLDGVLENIRLQLEEDLGVEGLWVEKGFINDLSKTGCFEELNFPKINDLEIYKRQNKAFLILLDENPEILSHYEKMIPEDALTSEVKAFRDQNLFIVMSRRREKSLEFLDLVKETLKVINEYHFYKGWPGYPSAYYAISTRVENPLDVVSKAFRERCRWVLFCGYHDSLALNAARKFMEELNIPILLSAGQLSSDGKAVMYRMPVYPNPQDSPLEYCIKYVKEGNGLIFIRYYAVDHAIKEGDFDGYLISRYEGDLVNKLDKPFIIMYEGDVRDYPPSMVLLIRKNEEISEETLFKAILDRRAIAIFPCGKIFGPSILSKVLKMLIVERDYLEEAFCEDVDLEAFFDGDRLKICLSNLSEKMLVGEININASSAIKLETREIKVSLKPGEEIEKSVPVTFTSASVSRENIAVVSFAWLGKKIYALAHKYIPEVVSTYSILYSDVGEINIPFSIYNYTSGQLFDAKIEVWRNSELLDRKSFSVDVPRWSQKQFETKISLNEPGEYTIKISALGFEKAMKMIAFRDEGGYVKVRKVDYDKDGLDEIVMENEFVKVTILPIGGRVIEYILKNRNENIFFVIWPKKPDDWKRPGRKADYWPYGGLEEFLSYPTFDGHAVFECSIEEKGPKKVRVKARANVRGNFVEKIFTLHAGSPILEVRYRLNVKPEINVLGVNPLLELGRLSDTQDIYYFPAERGIEERRVLCTRLYGECFYQSEGWAAGYDTVEDISVVMGFDADQPFLIHLWQNTPDNPASHHYYVEVQPWVKLDPNVDNYFTYYIMGYDGHWKEALEYFRKVGLLTKRTKPHLTE